MEENTKNVNKFVRNLIILLCIFITLMIGYNFIFIDPKGEISSGIVILLAFLLILALAESFDSFSIGKLISISRKIKKKETQNKELQRKNTELLNQLITVSNSQSQTQQHTNVYGDYNESPSSKIASEQIKEPNADKEAVDNLLAVVGDSIVIGELVSNINDELQSKGMNIEGDACRVLVKHLAGTQLLLNFEQIHNSIFGSQIFLLKKLNETVGAGRSEEYVFNHIDTVKKMFSDNLSEWTYDQYLAFLFSNILILKNEENVYHITNLGVEYLTWIARNGKRDDNPL